MSKQLTHTATYPKPIDQVWAILQDPAFQEAKLLDAGARNPKATVEPRDDGSVYIELERENPVVGVPGAVKKITGEWQHVIERMTYGPAAEDGSRVAEHSTEFIGIPLSMSGTLTLTPGGDVTTQTIDCEFKSSVPLVGGKLESTALEETRSAMDAEAAFVGGFEG